ncbi:MAG TPA: indole-3-glycerol phosphate synthase TrpC [Acetobacteraceae bacterium]|nr:indole-3-glycerol phosphate synthase TrpC [Acetobacteraceae bacterium]
MSGDEISSGTADALERICADTRAALARRKSEITLDALKQRIGAGGNAPRGFGLALKERVAASGFALIAEIKKASPSAGLIRQDFDPAALARAYEAGGATCLSVLTEPRHFQGASDHLRAVRAAVDLPILRKDFILDPWQVYESRAMGADAVLLIMAALTNEEARELEALSRALDMDVLAEVHDARELERALGLETPLIGINNRNLRTLKTDLNVTLDLGSHVPPDRFLVAESGIAAHGDVRRLVAAGAHCFLVGESLLRERDVAVATRTLLGAA